MIPAALHVEPGQENRIRSAIRKRKGCRIHVRKSDTCGPHRLLVTNAMLKRYGKAEKGKVLPLTFKPEHLARNMQHQGGFLPLIAAALAPIIGGVAGGLIEREIAGSGFRDPRGTPWWHGGGLSQGSGLYLNPWQGGSGLYLNPWPGH